MRIGNLIGVGISAAILLGCAADPERQNAMTQVVVSYNQMPSCEYVSLGGVSTGVERSESDAVAEAKVMAYRLGATFLSIRSVSPYPVGHASVSGLAYRCVSNRSRNGGGPN